MRQFATDETGSRQDPIGLVIVVLSLLSTVVLAGVAIALCAGW